MLTERERVAFHRNTTLDGRPLTAEDREGLMKPFLPPTSSDILSPSTAPKLPPRARRAIAQARRQKSQTQRRKPIRSAIKHQLHILAFTIISALFGIFIRLRKAYHAIFDRVFVILYYHHRSPEHIRNDVKKLNKLPEHLSVILQLDAEEDRTSALEKLIHDVGEVTAWSASASIPMLSIYERTGILKHYIPQTHEAVTKTLQAYFSPKSDILCPIVTIRVPNMPSFSPPTTPGQPNRSSESSNLAPYQINVLLISEDDGRNTIVDLTKTLAEMAQRRKLSPGDISSELVDAEISESVMGEPDLLILFGPQVMLEGYPPWQIRLTEIFHVPDNSEGVGYQVFLRALHRYAKARMRFGR